jgi:hypothetical protein
MIDEDSDWISPAAAVAHVEATQECYREKAVELVRQAAYNLRLKSRTVYSSPRWTVSDRDGQEIFHSDGGKRIEFWRKGLLELFPQRQNGAAQWVPPEIGSAQRRVQPISDGIALAIKELWPEGIPKLLRAKDRNDKIHEWLISRDIIGKSEDVSRTIQRVLKAQREGLR